VGYKPHGLHDDAWVMIVGYMATSYGEHAPKMAAGLVEMLESQGFKIVKKKTGGKP